MQLVEHRIDVRPVEADARGALLQFQRALPFRHAARDAGERARVRVAFRGALVGLDALPGLRLLVDVRERRIREHVRMARDHLVADRRDHVGEIEVPAFLRHLRVEHDLQQQIAELVAKRGVVAPVDRVGDFVGFLDRVRRDRVEVLFEIPRAAALADRAASP